MEIKHHFKNIFKTSFFFLGNKWKNIGFYLEKHLEWLFLLAKKWSWEWVEGDEVYFWLPLATNFVHNEGRKRGNFSLLVWFLWKRKKWFLVYLKPFYNQALLWVNKIEIFRYKTLQKHAQLKRTSLEFVLVVFHAFLSGFNE